MTLGEKIRMLRREKGMTQTQLAGSHITRNMLSQIENGSASPSLQTIYYLANMLEVSAAYLIADGEDDRILNKAKTLESLRIHLADGNYKACIEGAAAIVEQDDEISLMLAISHYRTALSEYRQGKLQAAQKSLLTSLRHASATIYPTEEIKSDAALLMRFMSEADANLPLIDIERVIPDVKLSSPDLYLYDRLIDFVNSGHFTETEAIINARLLSSEIYNNHITSKLMMARGDYSIARMLLESTIGKHSEEEIGAVMLLRLYSELEICHTHENNFEGAYNCANKKMAIIASFRN